MKARLSALRLLWWPLRGLFRLLLALLILFEEWGWEPLARQLARLAQWPPLRRLEAAIARLPAYAALAVLLMPALALLPVKLAALWLIGSGRAGLGLVLILLAKLLGTAVLARLFSLTQPALMQLGWFARLYTRWSRWKAELLAWLRGSWAWRQARAMRRWMRRWRQQWRRLLRMAA